MKSLVTTVSLARSTTERLRGEEHGATATEYAITVGFIAIVIVAGVGLFGIALNGYFGTLTTGVKTALGIP